MNRSKLTLILLILVLLTSCAPILPAREEKVISHPDGPLFVGDQVSFEVILPATAQKQDTVQVSYEGKSLGSASVSPFGIGGREEAALWWVWDTSDLKPGPHTLTFSRQAGAITWNETVTLHASKYIPSPEPEAAWAESITECCIIHYITGTAAARDIDSLSREADAQSADVSALMDHTLEAKVDVTLMPRVIGQGGFTAGSIYVSYMDDNYLGNEIPIVLHHEFVHFYDNEIGGGYRPSILEEGLAVYLSGGHFKPEPLGPRAAALLDLGRYIPLTTLANDFYNQQHDIGYLEAAGLIMYIVDTYGEAAFWQFYRTIPDPAGRTTAVVLDEAFKQYFEVTFGEMEVEYKAYLQQQEVSESDLTDLRLSVEFFDTARRYQEALDPSAYFLSAWLPDGPTMRQRQIVADFLRRPRKPQNRLVESLLVRAQAQLFSENYPAAERTLNWANWLLQLYEG
jgi:hypothetical protein